MKTRLLLTAAVAAVLTTTLSCAAPGADGIPTRSIALEEPGSPFVAFGVWIKAGSQNDPAGKEGLASLTASLLANGSTLEDPYPQILEKLYPMAAGYDASADKEMTVFEGRVHRDNLEAYYSLFRAALLRPAFSKEDFDRVKAETLDFLERGRRYNRDEELSKELLFWQAYQGTPYEHPVEGYVSSVESITLDDVRSFYETHYLRDNVVVGVGGGYPEEFVERVRADLDELPAGRVEAIPPPQPQMPLGLRVLIVEKETNASAISMGFPTSLLRGDDDFIAMMLVNSWFGEHRNSFSNLYQVIREQRGMNYGDYSYIEAFPRGYATLNPPVNVPRRSQLFEIWIRPISMTEPGTLHDRTLFATRAALRELTQLVEGGMTEEDFERSRQFLYNYTQKYGSTVTRRLAYRIDDAFYGIGGAGFLSAIRPGLASLALDEVNAAIRRHLQADNLWIVLVTADAEAMKRKLLSGEATPIDYAGPKPDWLLEEDVEIASFPIPVAEDDITILPIDEVFQGPGDR